eukprot:CAMPEP_0198299590 /NCGR_PEP_ID=MMETSP1449-20131203/45341_1 /TAXON_ID=420275 /ORGANISM="Attheya septentrionalis, Strain CCMP2084" /LENGTH=912 /DNA_ID=CAMNT_0044001201 /DNA_START=1 /DNA_END=2739 /DNA_ORIENTATION=-
MLRHRQCQVIASAMNQRILQRRILTADSRRLLSSNLVPKAATAHQNNSFFSTQQQDGSHVGLVAAALLAAAAALSQTRTRNDRMEGLPLAPWTRCDALTASAPSAALESDLSNRISSSSTSQDLARQQTQRKNVMLHRMKSLRARHMDDKYNVEWDNVLGEGAYGSVHPARVAATGEKVALKKISKRFTDTSSFKTETDALLRIYDNGGHPNISGLRDMYEDSNCFYLIMDLVKGGEMFEHLINYGAYSEADAARLIREVASALAFLHGVGVVHADLKPENLLLCSKQRRDGTIKLIDFGCAVVNDDLYDGEEQSMGGRDSEGKKKKVGQTISLDLSGVSSGTTAYWPPERFHRGHTTSEGTDMWSVGVILYIMMTGVHPFDVRGMSTDDEIEERIKRDPTPPMGPEFTGHLSSSAIDLIKKLMAADPNDRITADEMLQHPWILGETATTDKMIDSDKRLSRFKDLRNTLEAGIFAVLVSKGHRGMSLSESNRDSVEQAYKSKGREESDATSHIMKKAFEAFDLDGKGFVTSEDLGRVVSEATGSQLSPGETQEMLSETFEGEGNNVGPGTAMTQLSLSDFTRLFTRLKHKHFPRGHVIFRAGDEGDAMYFLNSGKIEVLTRKNQLVSILRHGDFFGEGSLLDENTTGKRFTTAKCATPVDVIKIKREDFDRYVASSASAKTALNVKWRARNLFYAKNLIRLQTNVKALTLEKGDIVYNEGDVGNAMYLVNEGELQAKHDGVCVHTYAQGDSFGESSLLLLRPRSSTVVCASDSCKVHQMTGEDFLAMVDASPEVASSLRDMCRKRLFKKAVKSSSLRLGRGLTDKDLLAAFHEADIDKTQHLNLDEVRILMHKMDPDFPESEIVALLKYVDTDGDGKCSLEEFKQLFRQFDKGNEVDHQQRIEETKQLENR